jgi:hypothetical protein
MALGVAILTLGSVPVKADTASSSADPSPEPSPDAQDDAPKEAMPDENLPEAPPKRARTPSPADAPGPLAPPASPDNVPVASELSALSPAYISFPDVEYRPVQAPPEGAIVKDLNGVNAETANECAQQCTKVPACNAATWMGANVEYVGPFNCWLKTIEVPCVRPKYAEAYPDAHLLMQQVPGCASPALL